VQKEKIGAQIRKDLIKLGANEGQLANARHVLSELGYTDQKYTNKRYLDGNEGEYSLALENLNLGIDTELLERYLKSSTDCMPIISKKKLTYTQLMLMSDTEKQQYAELRKKAISEQKASLHIADEDHTELLSLAGIKSTEEKDRKSTQIPPKQLWGKSDTYEFLLNEAEALECVTKYLYDIAKQVYVFKLGKELDKELQKDLQEMHDKVIIPMCKVSILKTNMVKYILDNVQDEKNRDTLGGWIQKAVHKFLDYGNHGTGEVDFIETGEHIMKLVNNQEEIDTAIANNNDTSKRPVKIPKLTWTILRIPIKREFTREQISDKTLFELLDSTNQLFIHCPNHLDIVCSKCDNRTEFHRVVTRDVTDKNGVMHVETKNEKWDKNCGLEWNVPIITDEKRDVIAGDYFDKALNILLNDPVNRVIEKICSNVIIMPLKTPEQFFKEEYSKREKELKGIDFKSIKIVNAKPTKIKEEEIEQSQKTDVAFNIFYGRSNRTWAKAEYFSGKA